MKIPRSETVSRDLNPILEGPKTQVSKIATRIWIIFRSAQLFTPPRITSFGQTTINYSLG